jgi:stage V sporulation protein G
MEVTEVKVKLVDIKSERLKAFCTITMDGEFVIRDIKIIEGGTGPFVAMPSRKLAAKCPRCNTKNHLRAKFCNECGTKLPESKIPKDSAGRIKLHADIAHPINPECRERIQKAVIEAYQAELERAQSPDYVPPHMEDFEDEYGGAGGHEVRSGPKSNNAR